MGHPWRDESIKQVVREVIRTELRLRFTERCPAPHMPTDHFIQVFLGDDLVQEVRIGDDGYVCDG